jgi:hypothetical protein
MRVDYAAADHVAGRVIDALLLTDRRCRCEGAEDDGKS